MHAQHRHGHINTFKATKDIAAGQEILVRYGSAKWFEVKNIPYADVDYASTMWRPDLHPLPYRRKVAQRTGADGRYSYAVLENIRPGSILEISLCVEVSVVVVDQLPFLWDFVLTGETEHEHTGCQQTSASSRAHTVCAVAPMITKSQRKGNWSTTTTDTSTHREISRTVPDRMTLGTAKLCRPSSPVV